MKHLVLTSTLFLTEGCVDPHTRVIVDKDEGRWACTADVSDPEGECITWNEGTFESPRTIPVRFTSDLPSELLSVIQDAHGSWQDFLIEQEATIALEDLEEDPDLLCEDLVAPSNEETRAIDEGVYVCVPSQEDWDFLMSDGVSGTGDSYGTTNMVYTYALGAPYISRAFVFLDPSNFLEDSPLALDLPNRQSTAAHEIGHALGWDHPNAPGVVMSPELNVALTPLCGYEGFGAVGMYQGIPCEDAW